MTNRYIHKTDTHNKLAPSFIVPEIIKMFNPSNVIDVGCGTGTFLSVFQDNGVNDVLGVEGEWLDPAKLEVDKSNVVIANLEKPFVYRRRFDLAICLEVAEHLSENSADRLVTPCAA